MTQYDIVEHIRILQKLIDSGVSFATITLVSIRGSAPQVVGAKAIVSVDGIEGGTVGGGKVEAAAIEHARNLLHQGDQPTEFVTWNLQTDIGMTCGGEVQLFFEVHARTGWPIAIFGAGHVAQSLVRLLVQMNCHVTCVDSRPEWLQKLPDDPKLTKLCEDSPKTVVPLMPTNTFFVLMSKGHATDLPVLAEILRTRDAAYVGVIGSEQKASILRRDLKTMKFSKEKLRSFHCPMGLPIGNNTPAEIAVSIAAQLIQVRDQRAGE